MPLQTTERWRPVVGGEGFYEVSDRGRVRSVDRVDGRTETRRGQLLVATSARHPTVKLRHGRALPIRLLVCEAFNGPRPDGCDAAHRNGDTRDNRATNLRWAPVAFRAGAGNGRALLTADDVAEMRRRWDAGGVTQRALAAQFGIGKTQVHNIVRRRQWV